MRLTPRKEHDKMRYMYFEQGGCIGNWHRIGCLCGRKDYKETRSFGYRAQRKLWWSRIFASLVVLICIAGTVQAANILGVAANICPAGGCQATPTPSATPTPPPNNTSVWRVNDFLNSMGAGTKLITGLDDQQQTINAIEYTGLRHFRDDATVFLGPTSGFFPSQNYLAMCNVHAAVPTAYFHPLPVGFEDPNNIVINQSNYEFLKNCGALDTMVEGPNEIDNNSITYQGNKAGGNSGSSYAWYAFQRDLYNMVKTSSPNSICTGPQQDLETQAFGGTMPCCTGQGTGTCPSINSEVVFGLSHPGAEQDNVCLQFGTVPASGGSTSCGFPNGDSGTGTFPAGTKLWDYANYHNYYQGNGPAINMNYDNQSRYATTLNRSGPCPGCWLFWGESQGGFATNGGSDIGTWAKNFPIGIETQNGIPKVTTETGGSYFNTSQGAPAASLYGKVITDGWFDSYQQGFSFTSEYAMINDPCDGGYGMFNPIATGTNPGGCSNIGWTSEEMDAGNATPLGIYTHNLTTILADTSSNFTPTALSGFAITNNCPASPTNNDSTNYPSMCYNQVMQKSNGTYEVALWGEAFSAKTTTQVGVNLGSKFGTVNVYDITLGSTPQQSYTNTQNVTVGLSDHLIIVEAINNQVATLPTWRGSLAAVESGQPLSSSNNGYVQTGSNGNYNHFANNEGSADATQYTVLDVYSSQHPGVQVGKFTDPYAYNVNWSQTFDTGTTTTNGAVQGSFDQPSGCASQPVFGNDPKFIQSAAHADIPGMGGYIFAAYPTQTTLGAYKLEMFAIPDVNNGNSPIILSYQGANEIWNAAPHIDAANAKVLWSATESSPTEYVSQAAYTWDLNANAITKRQVLVQGDTCLASTPAARFQDYADCTDPITSGLSDTCGNISYSGVTNSLSTYPYAASYGILTD